MNDTDIRRRIETAVSEAGTATKLARSWKVSAAYLSDVRAGRRLPGPKILKRLGLKRGYEAA